MSEHTPLGADTRHPAPQRVFAVGLGPLGLQIAKDLGERGLGTVAAAADPAPELAGRALRDLIPGADDRPIAASVTDAIASFGAMPERPTVAIVATSSSLDAAAETLRTLLRAGLNVVSTCEELIYPWLRHPGIADELHALAVENRVRVLGTGVNPGFMMDALPMMLSGVCRSVRSVTVYRIQDAATRRLPFQRKIGAGLDAGAFEAKVADGSLRHVGLGESIHFLADALGMRLARWEETIEPVVAERDMQAAVGQVLAGRAAGVRQSARGYDASGECVVRLEFQAAIGQPSPHDRVVIDGEPPIDMRITGGVHGDIATSAIVLNAIRPLLASPPGLHTMATIRAVRFAAP